MNYRKIGIGAALAVATQLAAVAQEPGLPAPGVRVEMAQTVVAGPADAGATFHFVAAQPGLPGKIVTGAPYSGEGFTETTQTLSDGTRINRRTTRKVVRDSQGRTREESTLPMLGPWAAANEAPRIVTIIDPVAKVIYNLNEKEKTAIRVKMPDPATVMNLHGKEGGTVRIEHREVIVNRAGNSAKSDEKSDVLIAAPAMPLPDTAFGYARTAAPDGKEESLGRQTLEGLVCDGKRSTHTIPAGTIGNDRAMVTTTERWISADLQVLVRSLTKDPQAGEVSYRLTNINRAEPAKTLFQIPADYTIKDAPGPQIRMMRKIADAEKE